MDGEKVHRKRCIVVRDQKSPSVDGRELPGLKGETWDTRPSKTTGSGTSKPSAAMSRSWSRAAAWPTELVIQPARLSVDEIVEMWCT